MRLLAKPPEQAAGNEHRDGHKPEGRVPLAGEMRGKPKAEAADTPEKSDCLPREETEIQLPFAGFRATSLRFAGSDH